MHLICPKCGAKSNEKEFIGAFCADCFEFHVKLPKAADIVVTKCKRCSKMFLGGVWQQFGDKKISKAVEKKCRGEFLEVAYDFERGILRFNVEKENVRKTIERPFPLEVKIGICPDCSRMSGGYFEAIIQLRGDNFNRLLQYAASLEKNLGQKTFISNVDETKDGVDLYVGDSKIVVAYFNKRGIKCVISSKLFGRKEGKLLYRTTFLVRL